MDFPVLMGPVTFNTTANSFEKKMRMPTTYHTGTPTRMQEIYFKKRLPLVNRLRKLPRFAEDCLILSNMPDSWIYTRNPSNASPNPPPIQYDCFQPHSAIRNAATAPTMPIPETMLVPQARVSFVITSETSVMPTPSSPASPKPAIKRSQEYCSRFCTKPLAMLASEYNKIVRNKVDKRPFLSPKMPQTMP